MGNKNKIKWYQRPFFNKSEIARLIGVSESNFSHKIFGVQNRKLTEENLNKMEEIRLLYLKILSNEEVYICPVCGNYKPEIQMFDENICTVCNELKTKGNE